MQKHFRLSLYYIDLKYIRELHKIDEHVQSVSPQKGKARKPFLGVIVINQSTGMKYAVPLSHYNKEKHDGISNKLDFQKVLDEKGKCISVLNINNMIPVTDAVLIPVDMKMHPNDSVKEKARKILYIKEITWCRKHADIIENKVKQLYELCTTASLDVENETLIQEALSKLIKDKTVLIIAHRMRTIANADKIVVLKNGVVAESGAPDYLKEIGGTYSHMINLQNLSANWKMA